MQIIRDLAAFNEAHVPTLALGNRRLAYDCVDLHIAKEGQRIARHIDLVIIFGNVAVDFAVTADPPFEEENTASVLDAYDSSHNSSH